MVSHKLGFVVVQYGWKVNLSAVLPFVMSSRMSVRLSVRMYHCSSLRNLISTKIYTGNFYYENLSKFWMCVKVVKKKNLGTLREDLSTFYCCLDVTLCAHWTSCWRESSSSDFNKIVVCLVLGCPFMAVSNLGFAVNQYVWNCISSTVYGWIPLFKMTLKSVKWCIR